MPSCSTLRLGTRGSALAQWQAAWVAAELRSRGAEVVLTPITTRGDRQQGPLGVLGGQGLFTKEIQRALLDNRIDLAVHSLKDLPTGETPGLILAAIPKRGPVGDILVVRRDDPPHFHAGSAKPFNGVQHLRQAAVIGTGSFRRRAQLLHLRPDLVMEDVRGNVETRLGKLQQGDFDGLVLAEAGLRRLGFLAARREGDPQEDEPEKGELLHLPPGKHDAGLQTFRLPWMLPAIGQGALGLETRVEDDATRRRLASLDDPHTHAAVTAERAMLAALHGGCLAPIAAYGRVEQQRLTLTGVVMSNDGTERLEATEQSAISLPRPQDSAQTHVGAMDGQAEATSIAIRLGVRLAEALLAQGAERLVEQSRRRPF